MYKKLFKYAGYQILIYLFVHFFSDRVNKFNTIFICLSVLVSTITQAEVVGVGPGEKYETLSSVASSLNDGDVVEIVPGVYRDCAILRANDLIIRPKGWAELHKRVRFQDVACAEQAIFLVYGNNIWIEGIEFANARVKWGNGAGVKFQGTHLFLQNAYFLNNEMGVLTGPNPDSKVFIDRSRFELNGKEAPRWGHGVYVGRMGSLIVSNSTFIKQKTGHHIKSRALYTEIISNNISDGSDGTASYSIDIPNGGTVRIENNQMQKGPLSDNHTTAICIACEGETNRAKNIILRNNKFINQSRQKVVFLRNLTAIKAQLDNNEFIGNQVVPIERVKVE